MKSTIEEISNEGISTETTIEYYDGNVAVTRVEFHEPLGASHEYIEIPFSKLENFVKKVKKDIEKDNSNS